MIVRELRGKVVLAKINGTGRKTEVFLRDPHIAEDDGNLRYRVEVDGVVKAFGQSYQDAKALYKMFA